MKSISQALCTQTPPFQFANSIRINSPQRQKHKWSGSHVCVLCDGVWSCVHVRINGGHIACCLTAQQAAWGSIGGAVCLDCVNNAPFFLFWPQCPVWHSSLSSLPVLFTQRKPCSLPNQIIFSTLCSCVLTVTSAWLIAFTSNEAAQCKKTVQGIKFAGSYEYGYTAELEDKWGIMNI